MEKMDSRIFGDSVFSGVSRDTTHGVWPCVVQFQIHASFCVVPNLCPVVTAAGKFIGRVS